MKGEYGQSEHGNFKVVDTIGVPHPYCIGARHVEHASSRFSGMLSEEAVIDGEKHGIVCEICKGKLTYKQHEQALLVSCIAPIKDSEKVNPELDAYLKSIVNECEANGYVGFAFLNRTKEQTHQEPTQ